MGLNLGNFIEKEVKYGEAEVLELAADLIQTNETKLETALAGAATTGSAGLIALVEKDDSGLGPLASGVINGALTTFGPALEADIQAGLAQGESYLPALLTAITNAESKLRTEAAAL